MSSPLLPREGQGPDCPRGPPTHWEADAGVEVRAGDVGHGGDELIVDVHAAEEGAVVGGVVTYVPGLQGRGRCGEGQQDTRPAGPKPPGRGHPGGATGQLPACSPQTHPHPDRRHLPMGPRAKKGVSRCDQVRGQESRPWWMTQVALHPATSVLAESRGHGTGGRECTDVGTNPGLPGAPEAAEAGRAPRAFAGSRAPL